jgi:hypothetical protein
MAERRAGDKGTKEVRDEDMKKKSISAEFQRTLSMGLK